jgi:hypothetical protein
MTTHRRRCWSHIAAGVFESGKSHNDSGGHALLRRSGLELERILGEERQELEAYYYMQGSIRRISRLKKLSA